MGRPHLHQRHQIADRQLRRHLHEDVGVIGRQDAADDVDTLLTIKLPAHVPQTRGLTKGLSGIRHVIMDGAHDAEHLRDFVADDMGATAHINCNPTRKEGHYIAKALYKEPHLI